MLPAGSDHQRETNLQKRRPIPVFDDKRNLHHIHEDHRRRNYLDTIDDIAIEYHSDGVCFKKTNQFSKIHELLKKGKWEEVLEFKADFLSWDIVGRQSNYSPLKRLNPLVVLGKYGHTDCMESLISMEAKNLKNVHYQDAFLEAVRGSHQESCQRIMEYRLLQNEAIKSRCSQIIDAAKTGDFKTVESLLRNFRVEGEEEFRGQEGNLINFLVMYGCPSSCLKVLLDQGINAKDLSVNNVMPLLTCAVLFENIDCLQFLLKPSVKLVLPPDENKTPLMFAACLTDTKSLETLLPFCGTDIISFRSDIGWTALTFACLYGNTKSVSMLLKAGAELEIFDNQNNSIIIPVMKSGSVDCLEFVLSKVSKEYCLQTVKTSKDIICLVENVECLSVFVNHCQIELDSILNDHDTFLNLAASLGKLESIKWLLEKGVDVNLTDAKGDSALMLACKNDHFETVEFLLDNGADVNIQNKEGFNASMYVLVYYENMKCLERLLGAGADVAQTDIDGQSAFTYAMMSDEVAGLEILFEKGQILEDGELKQCHKDAIVKWCQLSHNGFTAKTFSYVISKGTFDWSWWSGYTFRKIAFAATYCGVCPGPVRFETIEMNPLVLAFVLNDAATVKSFLANLYFFPEDYTLLSSNKTIRGLIENRTKEIYQEDNDPDPGRTKRDWIFGPYGSEFKTISCLLEQFTHQPLSLKVWSFVAASKAISLAGPPLKRTERVDTLPIPGSFKRMLTFQTGLSRVCRTFWKDLNIGSPGDLICRDFARHPDVRTGQPPHRCYVCAGLGNDYAWGGVQGGRERGWSWFDDGESDGDDDDDDDENEDEKNGDDDNDV